MAISSLMIEKLLHASHKSSNECSQLITKILYGSLPIKAATFYSFFESTGLLTLRAQTGFDYLDYKSFELPLDTLAGQSITRGEVIEKTNLLEEEGY